MRDDPVSLAREVERLRRLNEQQTTDLRRAFVQGRFRTDRDAPADHADLLDGDRIGDIVRTATYEYLLVNDSGTLKWARHAIDVTW